MSTYLTFSDLAERLEARLPQGHVTNQQQDDTVEFLINIRNMVMNKKATTEVTR